MRFWYGRNDGEECSFILKTQALQVPDMCFHLKARHIGFPRHLTRTAQAGPYSGNPGVVWRMLAVASFCGQP